MSVILPMLMPNFGNSLKMGSGVTKKKKTRKGSLGEVDCHLSNTVDIIFYIQNFV